MIGRREEGEAKPVEPDTGAGVEEELGLMHSMDAGVGEERVESSGHVRADWGEHDEEDDPFKT